MRPNPEKIVEEVRNGDGIAIFPGLIKGKLLERIQKNFDKVMDQVPDDGKYKFGKAFRSGDLGNQKNVAPALYDFLKRDWVKDTANHYFDGFGFSEVFWSHDYRNDQGLETNGHLHFDKIGPTLKFFIYLTDADRASGAMRICRNTRKIGEKLRKEMWRKTQVYSELKNKPEQDYPELGYTAEGAEDIVGPAGTVFVFDADLFHLGGRMEKGKERKVIRLHTRK